MNYLVLIYDDPRLLATLSAREADGMRQACAAHAETMRRNGHLLDAHRLQSPTATTCLRVRNGTLLASDGPVAESREQLGGYQLLEARDLNEAIRLASAIPWARTGCIEVRPLRAPSIDPSARRSPP